MAQTSQALKKLHDLLLRLRDAQEDLARGPRQVNARKAVLEKKRTELAAKRDRLKQLKVSADQKNLQLKTNESKLGDLRTKLNIANSNREYEIITGQIAADTMSNSVLEDEILEALTMVDGAQVEIRQAEQEIATAETELKKKMDDVAASEPDFITRVKALETEVAESEKILPNDFVLQYRRAVQAYGADALASVENRICSSCNIQLTPQKMVELNGGKLMWCTCGRLLYAPPS